MNKIEKIGMVKDVLGSVRFRVILEEDESPEGKILKNKEIVCNLCGKMYQKRIRIIKGDKVKVLLSIDDINHITGVIIFRLD